MKHLFNEEELQKAQFILNHPFVVRVGSKPTQVIALYIRGCV